MTLIRVMLEQNGLSPDGIAGNRNWNNTVRAIVSSPLLASYLEVSQFQGFVFKMQLEY